MSFFENNYPGVADMLRDEVQQRNDSADPSLPWNVETMLMGRWTIHSQHTTEDEARAAYEGIMQTCAPFARAAVRVTQKG